MAYLGSQDHVDRSEHLVTHGTPPSQGFNTEKHRISLLLTIYQNQHNSKKKFKKKKKRNEDKGHEEIGFWSRIPVLCFDLLRVKSLVNGSKVLIITKE